MQLSGCLKRGKLIMTNKEKYKNDPNAFYWSRVFKRFFLLLSFTSLLFGVFLSVVIVTHDIKNGTISIPTELLDYMIIMVNFINGTFAGFILAFLILFVFAGIPSFIWAIVLESLYAVRLKSKIIYASVGIILIVIAYHILGLVYALEYLKTPIFTAYLSAIIGAITTELKLHKS